MQTKGLKVEDSDGAAVFGLKVIPSSSRTKICGILDGRLKIKISAAPEKGKANDSVLKYLAEKLAVAEKQISILSGRTGPIKQIKVTGISADNIIKRLGVMK